MTRRRLSGQVEKVVDGHTIVVDRETSVRMGGIRQRDTAPELVVRKLLSAHGLRYRVANRDLPGSPDVANRSARWAVFVHGCYWHRHEGCRRATTPKRNTAFWLAKFEANVSRDRRCREVLEGMGYRVLTIWECEAESARAPEIVDRFVEGLRYDGASVRNCPTSVRNRSRSTSRSQSRSS